MPLMRYLVFVGGALLTLLLVVNACLPALPVVQNSQPAADLSVIRIHSDRKWPERVVFDTTRPTTSAPAPVVASVPPPQPPSQQSAAAEPTKHQVREAYAQLRPNSSEPRNVESKRKRKTVARNYNAGPPNYPNYAGSRRIVVAQQPPTLFFGNNVW